MIKPDINDYTTGGSMIAPYGTYDYESYAKALDKYIINLEVKIGVLKVQNTVENVSPINVNKLID